MLLIKRFFILAAAAALLLAAAPADAAEPPLQLADSPWPMYQHDPQHTGRSPFLGPASLPVLLWSVKLTDNETVEYGSIGIAPDGTLRVAQAGGLFRFDPVQRQVTWAYPGFIDPGTPLIGSDGSAYWGYGSLFAKVSSAGQQDWLLQLDPLYGFDSNPNLDALGNLYFVHQGLWSFTGEGDFRWRRIYYRGDFSNASPVIGQNGKIYAGGQGVDLCQYDPDGTVDWCGDIEDYNAQDRTSVVGLDGTIYHPSDDGAVFAITPEPDVKWFYQAEQKGQYSAANGMALAPDGTLYFAAAPNYDQELNYIYALSSEGDLKWKVSLPANPITQGRAYPRYPLATDQAGRVFTCPENSRCYGIGPDGKILWEFEFPLVNSIHHHAFSTPVIAADGLFYVTDSHNYLRAYADPTLYPILTSPVTRLDYDIPAGASVFTATVPISSTVATSPFQVSLAAGAGWLAVSPISQTTPHDLAIQINPAALRTGRQCSTLLVKPDGVVGRDLEIPICVTAGVPKKVYLPLAGSDPHRILHLSYYFKENQVASIRPDGSERQALAHNLFGQIYHLVYSPDARKIAVTVYWEGRNQIRVFDIEKDAFVLDIIHPNGDGALSPTWSPDSQRLAFISFRDDAENGEIYTIRLDGSQLRRVTQNQEREASVIWSPRGDKLAVTTISGAYVIQADGSGYQRIQTQNWVDGVAGWAPDGDRLLLSSLRVNYLSPLQLGIYRLSTGAYQELADRFSGEAVWSPDGVHIAFIGWETTFADPDLFVIKPDGSGRRRLSGSLDMADSRPAWSSSSKWLAFQSRDRYTMDAPNWDIFVVRLDGTGLMQVTENVSSDTYPFWVPGP